MNRSLDAKTLLPAALFLLGCAGSSPYPSRGADAAAQDTTLLAFADQGAEWESRVKLGVLAGSLVAAVAGALILWKAAPPSR